MSAANQCKAAACYRLLRASEVRSSGGLWASAPVEASASTLTNMPIAAASSAPSAAWHSNSSYCNASSTLGLPCFSDNCSSQHPVIYSPGRRRGHEGERLKKTMTAKRRVLHSQGRKTGVPRARDDCKLSGAALARDENENPRELNMTVKYRAPHPQGRKTGTPRTTR